MLTGAELFFKISGVSLAAQVFAQSPVRFAVENRLVRLGEYPSDVSHKLNMLILLSMILGLLIGMLFHSFHLDLQLLLKHIPRQQIESNHKRMIHLLQGSNHLEELQ